MKMKGLAVQGALAAGALALAYVSWQRPSDKGSAELVSVLDLSKGDLKSVRYADGAKSWTFERRHKPVEAVWIQETVRTPKPTPPAPPTASVLPDGGTAPLASASPDAGVSTPAAPQVGEMTTTERWVKGSERASEVYAQFTPLKATRALGVLPAEKLKELGFETTSRRLEVDADGTKHAFTLARVPELGSAYLKNDKNGQVYLLPSTLVTDLENASMRLVDRRLHAFKAGEFDALVVKAEGKERELVASAGPTPQSLKLAPKNAPDKPDELAKNWHDKVWRLVVTEVLGEGETPPTGQPTVGLRVDYLQNGKTKGFLELGKGQGPDVFARTENSAGWMRLHGGAEDLIKEAPRVVSGSGS